LSAPQVSICIPAYRQINYLRETLRSVREQEFEDYELIVSDDTPDDTVQQLVESFGFDDKLRYYHNTVSLGSPENWNAAVRHARGKFIKVLHHDDRFKHSGALGEFVRMLDENPEADFAFSASSAENIIHGHKHDHCPSKEQVEQLVAAPEKLFLGNLVGAPSATIYRNGLGIEYDGALKWLVDVDFYIRVLQKNSRFVYTPEVLIAAATNAEHQVTELCQNDAKIDLFEHLYVYRKIAAKAGNDPGVRNVWFRLFERYQIYSRDDLAKLEIKLPEQESLLAPFFRAYEKNRLKRAPYRVYARLPESLKRIIRKISKRL
jgi:glycosyltransferase involved in cell wall biosynthesis